MKRHLNTLFVTTQDACLAKDGDAVVVRIEKKPRLRVPLHNLGGIVCFGRVVLTQPVIAMCAQAGVPISLLSLHGRFLARIVGFTPGNVLLRREQYRRADDRAAAAGIAANMVAAKIANARAALLRRLRDYPNAPGNDQIDAAATRLTTNIEELQSGLDLDRVRGLEGEAARMYFAVFDHLITAQKEDFSFRGRTRRPPLDSVNALLSFVYALLAHDARAGCEAAGLDAAVGYLHSDRPGRPGLALDLMEEFRPFLADRLTLSLINRKQVRAGGFQATDSGAVIMEDATRKTVLTAYQTRKQQSIMHPFLREKTTVGLLVHLQARLLARHLRGDLDAYPPFLWK
jgi:CRISPR-associated protein Cas1